MYSCFYLAAVSLTEIEIRVRCLKMSEVVIYYYIWRSVDDQINMINPCPAMPGYIRG